MLSTRHKAVFTKFFSNPIQVLYLTESKQTLTIIPPTIENCQVLTYIVYHWLTPWWGAKLCVWLLYLSGSGKCEESLATPLPYSSFTSSSVYSRTHGAGFAKLNRNQGMFLSWQRGLGFGQHLIGLGCKLRTSIQWKKSYWGVLRSPNRFAASC